MALGGKLLGGISAFSAVVETGSFVKAGDVLDISQSGVSRAISRLEARLGIRLFDRTTRSVSLTDEGRRLYEQVMPHLTAIDDAAYSVSSDQNNVRGRLRVNVDPYFSRLVLAPKIGEFLKSYPNLTLELITKDGLGDMISDGFDLAIRFGKPVSSTLVAQKLAESRVLTVASPEYIKNYGWPKHPTELEKGNHVCIQFRNSQTMRNFSWEFHSKRKKIELEISGQLLLNDGGSLVSTCLHGYGIAQIFELGSESLLESGQLVDLFPDWNGEKFPLYVYYPSRHHVPAKTKYFIEFIKSLI